MRPCGARRSRGRLLRPPALEPAIRVLVSLLIALLLAVAVGVAAWSGFVALQRSGSAATPVPPIPPIVAPPRPERLPPAPEFARQALPAAAQRDGTTTDVVVRLPHLPALVAGTSAGVATYDARTGADFTWTPLDETTSGPDGAGLVVRTRTRVRGEFVVAFATAPQWARHAYLTRTTADAARAAAAPLQVDLSVAIAAVELALPATAAGAGPLRLVRCDDRQWLPPSETATGITVGEAGTTLLLGVGDYELVDPIDPTRRQRFTVPSDGSVTLSAALTRARADRP